MKKTIALILAIIIAAATLLSCGKKEEAARDASGKYVLSPTGEAVIDNIDGTAYKATSDNARVFYEIFVGSFSDSDGDGIGDLRGIINRMDYLNDGDDMSGKSLGVEGIWLTPIFKSSTYHKYDVTDYYTIDPAFGTEDDLRELISLCHSRNVKIIIDLPINHTSRYNDWFSKFIIAHRQGDTENKYYNYYSFYSRGESAPAGRSFAQLSGTDDFYECNFDGNMPELDFDNEDVRAEVVAIAKHYLDLGIDGFRFDAAKYIYFGDNAKSVEFWKWYMAQLRAISPDIYAVGEVWDGDGITDMYYPALNCFNFTTSQTSGLICETAKYGDANKFTSYVQSYVDRVGKMNDGAMILQFIANHDTDRAAGYLTVSSGQMQMAANVYLLSSGSPFIYYGEELGMRGSRGGAQTDANRRLAMIWGDGDTVKDPTGSTYPASTQTDQTAQIQKADGESLYSYYKKLIMIRKANPEICRGEYQALKFDGTKLGGFTSTLDGKTVCVIHNTTKSEITIDLSLATSEEFEKIAAVIGVTSVEYDEYGAIESQREAYATLDGTKLTISAQTSVVLR